MTERFPKPEPGQQVGDYEILAALGAGGMGCVYKVRNVISNREEAMKILLPDFASDLELAARFMAEIRTLAALEHPGIAQLRTAFQLQKQFVMVMEFVEGTTLEKLAVETRIPYDQILDYSIQVLAALAFAHRRGVTHRDIKPANIMITSHGLVKLMDFGIAKSANDVQLTRPGTTMGSVYYMSPEQVRGAAIDARSDLYSFGVTLYELLTGCKPFEADSSYGVLNAHLNLIPIPPSQLNPAISPQLSEMVMRAMAKLPEERFQTADEFRWALSSQRESPTRQVVRPEPRPQPEPEPQPKAQTQPPVMPAPVAAPQSGTPHRGLWIGIGAATATLALGSLAVVVPRILATHASPKPAIVAPDANPPTVSPPVTPPAGPIPSDVSSHAQKPSPGRAPANKPAQSTPSSGEPQARNGTPSPTVGFPAPQTGSSSRETRNARDRYADLEARADLAISAIQQFRNQQRAQGKVIRGDILGSANRARQFLSEAHRAIGEKEVSAANEYMSRAEHEITILEKFRGH